MLERRVYKDSLGANSMSEYASRLFERAGYNYLDIDPDAEPYSLLTPAELADGLFHMSLFMDVSGQWDRTAESILKTVRFVKTLESQEVHPIWVRLLRHAHAAPCADKRDALLEESIIPQKLSSKRWPRFSPALRYETLAAEIQSQAPVDAVLKTWDRFTKFFPEESVRPSALCAAALQAHMAGRAELAERLLGGLKESYPKAYELSDVPGNLCARIFYLRNLFPEHSPDWNNRVDYWQSALSPFDSRQIGLRYPELRSIYHDLISDADADASRLQDIHEKWQNFLMEALDLDVLTPAVDIPFDGDASLADHVIQAEGLS